MRNLTVEVWKYSKISVFAQIFRMRTLLKNTGMTPCMYKYLTQYSSRLHRKFRWKGSPTDSVGAQCLGRLDSSNVGGAGQQQPIVGTIVWSSSWADHGVDWTVAVATQSEGTGTVVDCKIRMDWLSKRHERNQYEYNRIENIYSA